MEEQRTGRILCPNCGVEYADTEPRCPFCGSMNLKASEKEYLDKIDDMIEDLGEVDASGRSELKREMRTQGRRAFRIVGVILAIAAIIGGIVLVRDTMEKRKTRNEYRWQREVQPEVDRMFEEGDYDALIEWFYAAGDEGHEVYAMRHREFAEIYDGARWAARFREELDREYDAETAGNLLYEDLILLGVEYRTALSDDERSILADAVRTAEEELTTRFQMTEEEMENMRKMLKQGSGYPYRTDVESFIKEQLKELLGNEETE